MMNPLRLSLNKNSSISIMKFKIFVLWVCVLIPLAGFADDFSLSDGREYKGVTVSRVEADGIVVLTDDGVEKLPFSLLPKEAKETYPYIPKPTPPPAATMAPAPAASMPAGGENSVPSSIEPNPQLIATPVANDSGIPVPISQPGLFGTMSPFEKKAVTLYLADLLIKACIALAVLVFALFVASFLVRRLLAKRSLQQKQTAFDAANAREFQSAYMDFFAIWKLWDHYLDHNENALPDHGEHEVPHATRWELLARAYMAESTLESIFLKLACEGLLEPDEMEILGRFRRAFQTLGEAIKNNKPLAWNDPEHTEYLAFKRLATSVSLLIDGDASAPNAAASSADMLRQITSNRWERSWSLTDAQAQAKGMPASKP